MPTVNKTFGKFHKRLLRECQEFLVILKGRNG